MRECFIRKNGSSFFATGLDGEKKLTFFSPARQKMKHQGFDFRRHLYLEEDTFNVKKREIIFFLLFIKFSIRSAVLLTVYIVLSFYFSLRGKNIRTSKFLTTSPQPYAEKKKSRCFCFKKIVATNWEFFFFFFRKIYRLIYTKTTWEVNMHSRFIVGCSRFQLAFDSFCQM